MSSVWVKTRRFRPTTRTTGVAPGPALSTERSGQSAAISLSRSKMWIVTLKRPKRQTVQR